MRSDSRRLSFFVAAMALALSFSLASASVKVGNPAPPLTVETLNGQTFDLGALHGKVVIVNFWATWCPSCREEMPALNAFYQRFHPEGLEMIGISADRHRDRGDVLKAMQTVSYPVAMLEDARDNGFIASELPTTFVIDSNGVVRAKLTPDRFPINQKSLEGLVLPLLPNHGVGKSPEEAPPNPSMPGTEPNK